MTVKTSENLKVITIYIDKVAEYGHGRLELLYAIINGERYELEESSEKNNMLKVILEIDSSKPVSIQFYYKFPGGQFSFPSEEINLNVNSFANGKIFFLNNFTLNSDKNEIISQPKTDKNSKKKFSILNSIKNLFFDSSKFEKLNEQSKTIMPEKLNEQDKLNKQTVHKNSNEIPISSQTQNSMEI